MRGTSLMSREAGIQAFEPVALAAGSEAVILAEGLFLVVDTLDSSGSLRQALTDPARPGTDKGTLVAALFGRLDPRVQEVVRDFSSRRWWHENDLADALEDAAVEALLIAAQEGGTLDAVEGEIFQVERLLGRNLNLYLALDNRSAQPEARIHLAEDTIGPKVSPVTRALILRAAKTTRGHRLVGKLNFYLKAAAARRDRTLARVTVAAPLSPEQERRLEGLLVERYGRGMSLAVAVDPKVVGGIRVRVGREVTDGTLLARLDDARKHMVG